jgi:hypothetical protein
MVQCPWGAESPLGCQQIPPTTPHQRTAKFYYLFFSQESTTGLCTEPEESNPQPHALFL